MASPCRETDLRSQEVLGTFPGWERGSPSPSSFPHFAVIVHGQEDRRRKCAPFPHEGKCPRLPVSGVPAASSWCCCAYSAGFKGWAFLATVRAYVCVAGVCCETIAGTGWRGKSLTRRHARAGRMSQLGTLFAVLGSAPVPLVICSARSCGHRLSPFPGKYVPRTTSLILEGRPCAFTYGGRGQAAAVCEAEI